MPSQFFGLNIAYTGLLASNAALNTTGNNIANVETEGYSRQKVEQQSAKSLRVYQRYGSIGAGVETGRITRVRDAFYDGKYWSNQSKLGEYESKKYYMDTIETYFKDDGTNAGFKTTFDQFMTGALEEWQKNPASDSTRAAFISAGSALTEYFNGMAGRLGALQKDINQEIKLQVDEINSLAGEIASLNKQINITELAGVAANELRDRRTLLLDKLSTIVDVEVTETPVTDTNNPERQTGANRCIVRIAGGQILVDDADRMGLSCVARPAYEKANQSDIDGLYDIRWDNGTSFQLYNASMGGSLQGLIQMRDGNNSEGFTGLVEAVGTDTSGKDTVRIRVDNSYLKDLNKSNLSDQGGILNIGNQKYYYDSWTLHKEKDASGQEVYSYEFVISDSTKNKDAITNDRVGKHATTGASVACQGIPYYMAQMNEWVRTFAAAFNRTLQGGYTAEGMGGSSLFTGAHSTDSGQFDFAVSTQGETYSIKNTEDFYYRLTASNFTIRKEMTENPGLLASKKQKGDGGEQSDLIRELKQLVNSKDGASFRGSSASEFLQSVISDIALNASRVNTFRESFAAIGQTINNQRISISGVDGDEEAVNLVKYQNSYNLASRMIRTLTEIYDRLILETGV